ncbi:hypothetical protein L917_04138 [Phytophthora nicotianae]|uniref:Post-SET domain-containing protein n=3 Tax=Phytophthora nicotianae TaxID=4792 RepID=W2QK82_PHYN3|nr:hypothetical protein PPTG_22383 [Phytophthora nicotianae INRA-310]ETL98870.1 hypothetical protein L917_04138 [Phytophthora nicotianae]ETN12660.1 hypothetical protein PPTG_22383 [Phytophthora nicotianae INRA-310]ETO81199.1 hypothetical protein F444_04438 [Phytophthora nicotianae P1976]
MPGGNSTNTTTTNVIGTVEHAFASVRLVKANVCAGGAWLTDSKNNVQLVSECFCGTPSCSGVIGVQRESTEVYTLPVTKRKMVQLTMDHFLVKP